VARKPKRENRPLTKQAVLDYLHGHPGPLDKRELARALHVTGAQRTILRNLLKELEREGEIDRGARRRFTPAGKVPPVAVIEIIGTDTDGELLAKPVNWPEDRAIPRIYVAPPTDKLPALGVRERALARLTPDAEGGYDAKVIRRLARGPAEIIGVFAVARGQGRIQPTDRRAKAEYTVQREKSGGAQPGDLVRARSLERRGARLQEAEVVEVLGHLDDPGAVSLIAINAHEIPTEFPPEAIAQAERAKPVTLGERDDLRPLPLITIDGEDARDFDDAVWAEADTSADNKGGYHLIVAIADVAWYVRPGDALDKSAYERGNSVYMPDRVVPMLPEKLSNNLCSLRPNEDRAVLAAHLWIDTDGNLTRHRFVRGLMRSAARCTYEQVQRLKDTGRSDLPPAVVEMITGPLYGAFAALTRARIRRGTLDLEVPEYKVMMNEAREIERIVPRARLDSHRVIEEYMITANVAAAETLEKVGYPCMYRVHDRPDEAKLESLREFLASLGLNLPRGQVIRSRNFADLLAKVADRPEARLVNETVLRSQAQALYSPDNLGHFGLALRRYAHFTSPIRRYSDLLVHRALISGLRLGEGGLDKEAGRTFAAVGEHISNTERRAAAAERDALERYITLFLKDRVGASFPAHISGVTRFGLFVSLDDLGAQGLIPIRTLGADFFVHDEVRHTLTGRNSGQVYRLGDPVSVELKDADPVTGSLVFRLMDHEESGLRPPRGKAARRAEAGRKPYNPDANSGQAPRRRGRKNSQRKPGRTRRR
jgi:ribonuclease R